MIDLLRLSESETPASGILESEILESESLEAVSDRDGESLFSKL